MKLTVFKDGSQVGEYELSGSTGDYVIGRDESSDILLDHARVSRKHAKVVRTSTTWKIVKLSEYDNLMVNGSSVEEKELSSGDQVSIPPFNIQVFVSQNVVSTESIQLNPLEDAPITDNEFSVESETDSLAESNFVEPVNEEPEPASDFDNVEEGSSFTEDGDFEDSEAFGSDDDEFAIGVTAGDEGTRVIQNFASYVLELTGEYAPFDKYTLEEGETLIGRDAGKVSLELKDPEVSSIHAKIVKKNAIITIEDMQSGNGTLLNGKRVNKATLEDGDELVIGSTSLALKVKSSLIDEEDGRLMPVEDNQVVEIEEIVEVLETDDTEADILGENVGFSNEKMNLPFWKDEAKRKKVIYALVAGALALVLFMDDEPKKEGGDTAKKDTKTEKKVVKKVSTKNERVFTDEEIRYLDPLYLSAKSKFENGLYAETLKDLEEIFRIADEYKNARQIEMLAKQGLEKLEELNRKKQEEIARKKREREVQELLKKAANAVDKREVLIAENYFSRIAKLEPENSELEALKSVLEIWKKKEEARKVAEAAKKAERQRMETLFKNTKSYFNRGEWYNSIIKLNSFLREKEMDDDLIREAQVLLDQSKTKLKEIVDPLLGKARSLKEAQDLKGVYETYVEVLKYDPANEEALNEIALIREDLVKRGKTVYREALISESLSLFDEAKDKFKEVMQISPEDSEYFKKAKDKLKQYLDYR